MKSFSICFAVVETVLLLTFSVAAPLEAGKKKRQNPEELTNFLLSPRYSQWLVGPVARIASDEERKTFLNLQVDEEAAAFISDFWQQRGGDSVFPTKGPKVIFAERKEEADRVFADGTYVGHRTDRGTIFVLYGEPTEIRFEAAPRGRGEFLEIWEYGREVEKGLDGQQPERLYHFVKKDGRTVFYKGPLNRQRTGAILRQ